MDFADAPETQQTSTTTEQQNTETQRPGPVLVEHMKKTASYPAPPEPQVRRPQQQGLNLEQLIYNATIRALKNYQAAAKRLELAQHKVAGFQKKPDYVTIDPEAEKAAAAELAEAVKAFEALGQ